MALEDNVAIELAPTWPTIRAEKTLLRQIYQNLIANGIKFNASPIKRISLGWEQRAQGGYLLWVRDNGIGIAPRYQEQIFGLFERLHRQQDYDGTGIGLALVRKAVRMLGGNITVESKVGEGSTFLIEYPNL